MKRIFLLGMVLLLLGSFTLLRGFAQEKPTQKGTEETASFKEKDIGVLIDEAMEDVDQFFIEIAAEKSEAKELGRLPLIKEPAKPIDLEFTKANLEDVLRVIAEAGQFNVVLDPELKGQKVDIHLKKIGINDALEVLYSAYGLSSYQIGDILFVSTKQKIREGGLQTSVIDVKNINVEEAKALIETLVEVMNVSKETNTLVIMAAPDEIKRVEEILAKVDIPQPQVLLEAKVIEITTDSLRAIGVDWSDSLTLTFQESKRKLALDDPAVAVGSPFRIYRLAHEAITFDATIHMLEESGDAKILSNPRVTTINNKQAEIFIGDKVPYEITSATGGVATTEVRFVEAGIRLKVTPAIIEKDFTLIKIEPEVSYIYGWRGADNQYPWVKTRQATAYVRVKNKQPFALGGLLDKEDSRNLYKVPLLGSIPLLGNLFKYERTTTENTELIITITPTIIWEES